MEYEKRKSKRLANDVLKELRIMKRTYESCMGQTVRGFIQGIGSDPFFVLFYLQEQVESYIEACRNRKAIIHFDSTGSVMKGFPEQKRPYYYAVVLSGSSMPLLEFITTCHHASWLVSKLDFFWRDVTILCNGRRSVPKVAVVDFSFALINTLMTLFNRSSVTAYLQDTWNFLMGHTNSTFSAICIIVLCCAHFIKSVANTLIRREQRKCVRQAVLVMVSTLQWCKSLSEASSKYRAAHTILTSTKMTGAVAAAKQLLLTSESDAQHLHDKVEADETQDDHCCESRRSIANNSPFTRFFPTP
jgi:hypothetical protein